MSTYFVDSTMVPLPLENVDTDQIIPARFLKATSRDGFGQHLFADLRFNNDGSKTPFVLNNSTYSGQILVAGKNFGCGSSREHAAWALSDYGFKVVVSSFFADIFKNNALNNHVLPIVVEEEKLQKLFSSIESQPNLKAKVDLEQQVFSVEELDLAISFQISPYKKECLLKGMDDLTYLLSLKQSREEFERNQNYPIAELSVVI